MIKLEVTKSPSPDEIGIFHFQFDEVIIGATLSNDIILTNQNIKDEKIKIFFDGKTLFLETMSINQFIILNNKKMSGRLKIQENDRISFGECEIKVCKCEKNNTPDTFPYEKYEKILMNNGLKKIS